MGVSTYGAMLPVRSQAHVRNRNAAAMQAKAQRRNERSAPLYASADATQARSFSNPVLAT